jgi:hypothetical protein
VIIMSTTTGSELALNELKKQARRLGKAAEQGSPAALQRLQPSGGDQHKHCLLAVSREAGFRDWQQARAILSGTGQAGDDFGTLWLGRPGGGFLNEWFARYGDARRSWEAQPGTFLLPYKTQCVVVGRQLMLHHGLAAEDLGSGLDLLAEAGTPRWDRLARQRLRALFAKLAPTQGPGT